MGLLAEVQLALPLPRLAQLTNADLPSNPNTVAVAGTISVVNGSAAIVGTGTTFTTALTVGNVLAFSPQRGVNYTVQAVADDTHATLAVVYSGATNGTATALTAGINYTNLQAACNYAVSEFMDATNLPFDDTTVTNYDAVPAVVNRSIFIGITLVIVWLYRFKGDTEAEDKAQKRAELLLKRALNTRGDGAWAAPASDSVYTPSQGPARLPDMDPARLGGFVPYDPGHGYPGAGPAGGGAVSDWTG